MCRTYTVPEWWGDLYNYRLPFICTAIAKGYQLQGREIGTGEAVWYATGKLEVSYLKPVRIDQDVQLIATIESVISNKMTLSCELFSGDDLCCTSQVVAVKVPNSWFSAV